jgi:L-fuculose-phosphate aldolase
MIDTNEQQMREALVAAYCELVDKGLMDQASGNVSCRVTDGMLISCSGATAKNLTAKRVVMVRDDGGWDGEVKPSSEWRMHQAIYQSQDKANAVIHTHSDYCVALACNNLPLPGFHYMVGTFGGPDVPCVPYSTFGTEQLATDAAEALTDRAACLLGNHGMICRGANFEIAVAHAERMEILCKHYVLAKTLGEPDILTNEQWDEFFGRAKKVAYSTFI